MKRDQPRNGGNGHTRARLSAEQQAAFRNLVLLSKQDRREILDMVIMYELVEDRPEGAAIRGRLRAA